MILFRGPTREAIGRYVNLSPAGEGEEEEERTDPPTAAEGPFVWPPMAFIPPPCPLVEDGFESGFGTNRGVEGEEDEC